MSSPVGSNPLLRRLAAANPGGPADEEDFTVITHNVVNAHAAMDEMFKALGEAAHQTYPQGFWSRWLFSWFSTPSLTREQIQKLNAILKKDFEEKMNNTPQLQKQFDRDLPTLKNETIVIEDGETKTEYNASNPLTVFPEIANVGQWEKAVKFLLTQNAIMALGETVSFAYTQKAAEPIAEIAQKIDKPEKRARKIAIEKDKHQQITNIKFSSDIQFPYIITLAQGAQAERILNAKIEYHILPKEPFFEITRFKMKFSPDPEEQRFFS